MRGWKKGRPRTEHPRENIVKVYLNDEEYVLLDTVCRNVEETKSAILRKSFMLAMKMAIKESVENDQMD